MKAQRGQATPLRPHSRQRPEPSPCHPGGQTCLASPRRCPDRPPLFQVRLLPGLERAGGLHGGGGGPAGPVCGAADPELGVASHLLRLPADGRGKCPRPLAMGRRGWASWGGDMSLTTPMGQGPQSGAGGAQLTAALGASALWWSLRGCFPPAREPVRPGWGSGLGAHVEDNPIAPGTVRPGARGASQAEAVLPCSMQGN